MDPETRTEQDGAFDPAVGMVVTEAGKATWRRRLAERAVQRDSGALADLRERLRLGPAAQA